MLKLTSEGTPPVHLAVGGYLIYDAREAKIVGCNGIGGKSERFIKVKENDYGNF